MSTRQALLAAFGAALIAAASAGASFSGASSNPGNSLAAADSFCVSPGEQVLSASRDVYVDSLSGSTNGTTLSVRSAQVLLLSQRRALVGFDLPAVPSSCTLSAATLRLYATSPNGGRAIQVSRASSSWSEASAAFSATNPTSPVTSTSSLSSPGWQSWDVLGQVETQYSSGTNNGFTVKDSQDSAVLSVTQTYQSRQGTPDTQDPELRLTFE